MCCKQINVFISDFSSLCFLTSLSGNYWFYKAKPFDVFGWIIVSVDKQTHIRFQNKTKYHSACHYNSHSICFVVFFFSFIWYNWEIFWLPNRIGCAPPSSFVRFLKRLRASVYVSMCVCVMCDHESECSNWYGLCKNHMLKIYTQNKRKTCG